MASGCTRTTCSRRGRPPLTSRRPRSTASSSATRSGGRPTSSASPERRVHRLGPGLLGRLRRARSILARTIARYRPDVVVTHYPVGPYMIDSNAFTGVYASRAMRRRERPRPRDRRRRAAFRQGAVLLPDGPVGRHALEDRHGRHRRRLLRRHHAGHRAQGAGLRPVREPGLRRPVRAQGGRGARRSARHARQDLVRRAVHALAEHHFAPCRSRDGCSTAPTSRTTCRATS